VVSLILQGCQEACKSAVSLEYLKVMCVTSLNSSLDLISCRDRDPGRHTSFGCHPAEFTLALRDSILRKLSSASPAFKESLRNAPFILPDEPVELPVPEESVDLFGGLTSGLSEYRLQEASSRSTDLVLRAYYGKDSHKCFKRPASPSRNPQSKRSKAGPNYRQHAPAPVVQSESRPFSGPPERCKGTSRLLSTR